MRAILTYAILLNLLFSSCSTPMPPTIPNPETTPAATPTPGTTPTQNLNQPAPTLPDVPVIEYHLSGGIQGLDETYMIYSDGRITSPVGGEWTVPPEEAQQLLAQIEQTGLFGSNQSGPRTVPCCDRFSYTLKVRFDGKTYIFQTYDGAENLSEAIQSAFDVVAGFIQDNTASGESEPIK
jgi:hypothetical protein